MNIDNIDEAFAQLLSKKAVHKEMKVTANYVAQLRLRLRNDIPISTELKLKLLQKSGWRQSDHSYTRKDLLAAIKFTLKASAAAKAHGPEYLVEKFLTKR
jgi:hypothetical protein